jgi:hypothetical protein
MILTRRMALAGGAAAAGALAGLAAVPLASDKVVRAGREVVEHMFGPEVARHDATDAFLEALSEAIHAVSASPPGEGPAALHVDLAPAPVEEIVAHPAFPYLVTQVYGMSTTVVLHAERGDELEFLGLYHPHNSVCTNPLSAFMAA